MTKPEMFDDTLRRLDRLRPRVLAELHPMLRERVVALLVATGGRVTPWEGYRNKEKQEAALARGTSHARWGESPHNFKPSMACDLVLDPRHVEVRTHPKDRRYPWLWDNESTTAVAAWVAVEKACGAIGLDRVMVGGVRDLPHVQLPNWRSFIPM
jgi:hypothetical protein